MACSVKVIAWLACVRHFKKKTAVYHGASEPEARRKIKSSVANLNTARSPPRKSLLFTQDMKFLRATCCDDHPFDFVKWLFLFLCDAVLDKIQFSPYLSPHKAGKARRFENGVSSWIVAENGSWVELLRLYPVVCFLIYMWYYRKSAILFHLVVINF